MPRIFQMLKTNEPILEDNFQIILSLDNQSQEKVLREKAFSKLAVYLKNKLQNKNIKLNIKLGNSESKTGMAYTNIEKFNYLAELNDSLNTLKQKFNLDFE